MLNINSLMTLLNLQQIQQLQRLFTDEEPVNTNGTNTLPFADIFATLLAESDLMQTPGLMGLQNKSTPNNSSELPTQLDDSHNRPTSLENIFDYFASQYNLNPNLLKAVAKVESNFDPSALSSSGAQGIMQLMPRTAQSLGVTDSFNPVENIEGGAKYLRDLLNTFDGNTEMALAAYNAGPTAVSKYGGIPPYKETQNYVKKVMNNFVDTIG